MRTLSTLDWVIIAAYCVATLVVGAWLTRRASRSVEDYFVAGRTMPWWLVGASMAATNLAIDTPLAVSKFVAQEGISGMWFTWSNGISAVLVTFLFAALWRRSGTVTDAELVELRYGGTSAAALRLAKGFYFGVVFNIFIMGWNFVALRKVVLATTTLDPTWVLIGATAIVFVYSVSAGLYGVMLTDLFQYIIALGGSIVLAYYCVKHVGGLDRMVAQIQQMPSLGPEVTRFAPSFEGEGSIPLSMFLAYVLVQWWAHKYADGGGKHIQRMLSATNERESLLGSLSYAIATYAIQVWPWILTALCALVVYGRLDDPERGYPLMMARVLPSGLLGLGVACLLGAFMSTIDTHLNLGGSYIINDIYRRFFVRDRAEKHYVFMSRVASALLITGSVLLSLKIQSIASTWKFLLTFASGAGLTWIIRWFWWRANAWTEISAMVTSGIVASYLELAHPSWAFGDKLMITVAITTVAWVAVTLCTPAVPDAKLAEFVRRIRPGSLGWRHVYARAGLSPEPFLGGALLNWLIGMAALFALNFAIGHLLIGDRTLGAALLAGGVLTLAVVLARTGLLRRGSEPSPAQEFRENSVFAPSTEAR